MPSFVPKVVENITKVGNETWVVDEQIIVVQPRFGHDATQQLMMLNYLPSPEF